MNFRTVGDLALLISQTLHRIPRDIEVICGIPRSGLIPANLLALHLNLPLTDVEGLAAGRLLGSGERRAWGDPADFLARPRRVLVVDDSILSGAQMGRVKARLAQANTPHHLTYAVAYTTPDAAPQVDLALETLPMPRIFEWNVMHHVCLENACVDIDGLLCLDPTEEENDDGPRYEQFLATVPPLFRSTRHIGTLVTCRLEKYRRLTEVWLAQHGIRATELVMLDLPDKATRQRLRAYGSYKAEVYRARPSTLFIESNPTQSAEIALLARKPVLCLTTRQMFYPPQPPATV